MTQPIEAKMQTAAAKEKLIVALDVETADQARNAINELSGSVGAFKIGLQLFTCAGPNFVREVARSGTRVFLDLKFHDIPNTVACAAVEAARLGVWMFNVHSLGGREMMRQTAERVGEACDQENINKPHILGVTVLTSSTADDLRDAGIDADPEDEVVRLARLAAQSGLSGVVASAREVKVIRREIDDERFLIVTPGIRPGNATVDDQKRVMNAADALRNGASYLVVGRPIMQAEDRLAAVEGLLEEIETAFK